MIHVARSVGRDYDAVMDCYAYVLEQLKKDDFRRLRAFVADGRGKFSTWLTVVTRRLCLDRHREKYGRVRGSGLRAGSPKAHTIRRRLTDLVVAELDVTRTSDPASPNPEMEVRRHELAQALADALDTLSARERLVLAMRFEDGLPAREIAAIMGYPTLFHVYRHVNAVLERLREVLQRRGVREPTP